MTVGRMVDGGKADHAPLLERAFNLQVVEHTGEEVTVEGDLPPYLRGTYYLNGPARFTRGSVRYRHWLDGDGMVSALKLGAERHARFTNRFVRGHKYRAEEAAGKALYRTFGTAFPNDQLKRGIVLESPVNVSVVPYAGKLLAFGEQGLPWELDPTTLETRGEETFGGRLNEISPFSAHPCVDPQSGEMLNFGVSFSGHRSSLRLYRFNAAGSMVYRRRIPLEHPVSIHDFRISPSWVVIDVSPYVLDMEALTNGSTLMEALRWQPELGSFLLVVRREDGEPVARVPTGAGYCLHLSNAFEEDGHLVVDLLELDRPVYDQYTPLPKLFVDVRPGRPRRLRIDTASWNLVGGRELPYARTPDFPVLDPRREGRRAEHVWMLGMSQAHRAGRKFFDELVHLRWDAPEAPDIFRVPQGCYLAGEPSVVADPEDPEAASLVCPLFDAAARRTRFLVFNAHDIASGPRATIHLASAIPPGFHACWVSEEDAG